MATVASAQPLCWYQDKAVLWTAAHLGRARGSSPTAEGLGLCQHTLPAPSVPLKCSVSNFQVQELLSTQAPLQDSQNSRS